jgi:hypothetical protein
MQMNEDISSEITKEILKDNSLDYKKAYLEVEQYLGNLPEILSDNDINNLINVILKKSARINSFSYIINNKIYSINDAIVVLKVYDSCYGKYNSYNQHGSTQILYKKNNEYFLYRRIGYYSTYINDKYGCPANAPNKYNNADGMQDIKLMNKDRIFLWSNKYCNAKQKEIIYSEFNELLVEI